jgi:predicted metal-dependent peptidase
MNVPDPDRALRSRVAQGLRMVTVTLPHLSGLAAAVRFEIDARVPTMGIFASGRLLVNRDFTTKLSGDDLVFVLAHELLHLALRTHERARGASTIEFNYAHDYIINDMLRHALSVEKVPAGGLDMPGAREKSAEQIVLEMRRSAPFMPARSQVWGGGEANLEDVLEAARRAGAGDGSNDRGDVFDEKREAQLFPDDVADQAERIKAVRELAARGAALGKALGLMKGRGNTPGGTSRDVQAERGIYRTPWQAALQRCLEGVTPGERSFQRASRRGAERTDIVMPGRQRYGQMLNVILDTSGSMSDAIPGALGAIADFCEQAGVDDIRLVQCDTEVTGDELLTPPELAAYQVKGYGGSDLTPAMRALAEDPRVANVVIITDGDIGFPGDGVPYAVLWAVPGETANFDPPYGRVITMKPGGV